MDTNGPTPSSDFSVLRAIGQALQMDFERLNDPDYFAELMLSVSVVLLIFGKFALLMLAAGL